MRDSDSNPYAAPHTTVCCAADSLHLWSDGCLHCGAQAAAFWPIYLHGRFRRWICPACRAPLTIHKRGLGRYSEWFIAVPLSIVVGAGVTGVFWHSWLFLLVLVLTIVLDYLVDRQTSYFSTAS